MNDLQLLGMKDEAIADLNKEMNNTMAESSLSLVHLPVYDSLREDPRFQDILETKKQTYKIFLKMSEKL